MKNYIILTILLTLIASLPISATETQCPIEIFSSQLSLTSVRNAISCGQDLNEQDEDGFSPLMHAVVNGQTEIVRLLISQQEINLNLQSYAGYSALMVASQAGHIEIVRELVSMQDVDLNLRLNTSVSAAVRSILSEEQIALHFPDAGSIGRSALELAASNGHTEIVQELVKHSRGRLARDIIDSAKSIAQTEGYQNIVHILNTI